MQSALPDVLQSRLHGIYEKHEFDEKRFGPMCWLGNGQGYALLEPSASGQGLDLVRYGSKSGKREVLIAATQLTAPGTSSPLVLDQDALRPDRAFALSSNAERALFATNVRTDDNGIQIADYWLFDRKSGALSKVASEVQRPDTNNVFSPDGSRIVYTRAHNLYVQDVHSGETIQLTTDGILGSIGNGISDWGGWNFARWSPDGRRIAYVQVDSRAMGQFPLINHTEAIYPEARYLRFPKVGTPIFTLRVGVVSASGGTTRWIELPGEAGSFYIEELDWAADSEELLIQKQSRSRDAVDVFLASAHTGAVTLIHHEQDAAWVRDSRFADDSGFEWIRDGTAFAWLSERSGWRQAYTVSSDGKRQTLVTPDSVDVVSTLKVDEKAGWLYYIASPENATQRYLYRVRLDGSKQGQRVTPTNMAGTHSYEISPDARWAVHTWSTADTPPVTQLIELPQHQVVRILEDNASLRAKLGEWDPRPTEFLQIDIGAGVIMDAWMLKPRDFDATKKYPVFVFVYGEPAGQTVLDSWSNGQGHNLFHRAIADSGYLVISIDNRGSPAPKGSAWRRAVYGSLGPLSTEEQAAGLREVGRMRPYVDLSRVGIWGWSAGGTNTLNALFRKPGQYHVGIAVVPKPRPDLYNAWFQEIFMRTPEENQEGYRTAAPINFAEGLKGRLLIVHGTGETNTHLQIVEHLVNRLIDLGKPFDYMVYPNRNHNMRQGEQTRPHLFNLIARYLMEHLPPGGVSHENHQGDRLSSRPSPP